MAMRRVGGWWCGTTCHDSDVPEQLSVSAQYENDANPRRALSQRSAIILPSAAVPMGKVDRSMGRDQPLGAVPSPVDVELAFPTKPISSLSTGVRKGSEVGKSEPASQRVFRTGEAVPASASVYRMTGPHRLTKHSMRPATSKLPPAHRDRIEATQDLDSRTCVSDPPIELLF